MSSLGKRERLQRKQWSRKVHLGNDDLKGVEEGDGSGVVLLMIVMTLLIITCALFLLLTLVVIVFVAS